METIWIVNEYYYNTEGNEPIVTELDAFESREEAERLVSNLDDQQALFEAASNWSLPAFPMRSYHLGWREVTNAE